jgi:steroid delta-isomerase-like uncharacterized protein
VIHLLRLLPLQELQGTEEDTMHGKMQVIVAILALTLGGTAAYSADNQALERLLDQWAIGWSSSDSEMLMPLFTDNIVYEDVTFGSVNRGKTALRDFATATFGAFADLKFELTSRMVAADGKSGAMEWVWRGRQTKDFPGLPATNKPFEVRGATIVQFNDGRISRNSDYWDLATYMKQVGLAVNSTQ